MSTTTKISVNGMSIGHCVASVTDKVNMLDGVIGVDVDLAAGTVQITSDALLDAAELHSAIDESGYEGRYMIVPTKLAAFGALSAAVFPAALGVGAVVGPVDNAPTVGTTRDHHPRVRSEGVHHDTEPT